jgi:hypothetical protein
LTENVCSRYRVHPDVDVDIVCEVRGKDLGSGYPGSFCRSCVRAKKFVSKLPVNVGVITNMMLLS